jgi:signal transduction histidine kinase
MTAFCAGFSKSLRFSRLSLQSQILLSTSIAITILFAVTGWIVLSNTMQTTSNSLEGEVQASFQAYKSLWSSRADQLSSTGLILSGMSDVRAAFGTGDEATIQDTAGELWARISHDNAMFLVTDPQGKLIASLGGMAIAAPSEDSVSVRAAAKHFPRQSSGFMVRAGRLYQIAVNPVYIQSADSTALLNVLVVGYQVNNAVAEQLKQATGGSEFVFLRGGQVIASTLNPGPTNIVAKNLMSSNGLDRVSDGATQYAPLKTALLDIDGNPIGQLWILRSFEGVRAGLARLRSNIILVWLVAIAAGLGLTFLLARKIVEPVKELDRAAAEVSRQNYHYRVDTQREDELGRLANTFNTMCASIQQAQAELVRHEQIATIGRLSGSIVHDLRNPLAAIYGGSEMLVDNDLAPAQMKRLAGNIYRASRRIQSLLQDLLNVSQGKNASPELARLREVAFDATESVRETAEARSVTVSISIPQEMELVLERNRIERVFTNLVANALEAMPKGGDIRISARVANGAALVEVRDDGPGIAPQVRANLFQPFVSVGKKNGLGLGLALSRQTVLDHGGDMWVESEPGRGANFCFRLPMPVSSEPAWKELAGVHAGV